MQFPPSFLDEIRQRLRPSSVLGKDLRLIPKGRGEFMALCPFHKEKSPSFSISDDKEFYHCFGCGAHGDVIRFTMEYHKLSFPDAVTQLAGEAGLPLPKPETTEQKQARERSDILKELMEWTAVWYQSQLKTPNGDAALQYLKRRGLSDEVLAAFRIGYAPESRTALKTYLVSKGGQIADMVGAGLLIQPESGDAYDRFRGRVMFPIVNVKGEVIAFGGRALKDDQQPKYLNSPETPLFHKGRQLYNFARARASAKTENRMIVVEGYMDVIALYRAGIHTAVAPLGTALTEDQLQLLWSVVPEPILCMDGDGAGQRAMQRAAYLALPKLKAGHSLKSAFLPKGQDPDDVLASAGAGALNQLLEHTEPLAEMVWRFDLQRIAPQTPEQRAALEKAVLDRVQSIEDKSVRDHYRQFMQQKLWEAKSRKKNMAAVVALPPVATLPKRNQLEAAMVGLILDAPHLLLHGEVEEFFTTYEYSSAELTSFVEALRGVLESKDFSAMPPEIQSQIAETIEPSLHTQGFTTLLNALKTQRFVDKSRLAARQAVWLNVWQCVVAELNAEQIAGEYEQFVREWWEKDAEKVEAFREQKEQTEQIARKTRQMLMTILDNEG